MRGKKCYVIRSFILDATVLDGELIVGVFALDILDEFDRVVCNVGDFGVDIEVSVAQGSSSCVVAPLMIASLEASLVGVSVIFNVGGTGAVMSSVPL